VPLAALNDLPPLPPTAPLADKLARSRAVLAAVLSAFAPAHMAVAYTGGKDSGVALFLYREALSPNRTATLQTIPPLKAITIDTGCKFPCRW
jgi:phosphoadenosine phosphosulfate reductase